MKETKFKRTIEFNWADLYFNEEKSFEMFLLIPVFCFSVLVLFPLIFFYEIKSYYKNRKVYWVKIK